MTKPYSGIGWYRLRDESLFVKPYLAGVPVSEIAENTQYSEDSVRRILKARGVWRYSWKWERVDECHASH